MNRFARYSRISPLELCLEAERRAWRVGLALWGILLAVAAGGLFLPAPDGEDAVGNESDFCGVQVVSTPAEPAESLVLSAPLPQCAAVMLPEVVATPELLPLAVEEVECELPELEAEDAVPICELPESLARPVAPHRAASPPTAEPGGKLVAARYRSTPPPPYPTSLLNRRVQGRVGLRVVVDAEGVPSSAEIASSSGHAAFDRCARDWVLAHWRFYPACRGGVPIASVVRTQVEFVLR